MKAVRKKRGWAYRGIVATLAILAVVVGAFWVASFWYDIIFQVPMLSGGSANISFINGGITCSLGSYPFFGWFFMYPKGILFMHIPDPAFLLGNKTNWSMFHIVQTGIYKFIVLPGWAPVLALLSWPVAVFARWLSAKRVFAAGLCPACGYNLRGSKQSTSCPECGEVI